MPWSAPWRRDAAARTQMPSTRSRGPRCPSAERARTTRDGRDVFAGYPDENIRYPCPPPRKPGLAVAADPSGVRGTPGRAGRARQQVLATCPCGVSRTGGLPSHSLALEVRRVRSAAPARFDAQARERSQVSHGRDGPTALRPWCCHQSHKGWTRGQDGIAGRLGRDCGRRKNAAVRGQDPRANHPAS
jgi:hypothetical protein